MDSFGPNIWIIMDIFLLTCFLAISTGFEFESELMQFLCEKCLIIFFCGNLHSKPEVYELRSIRAKIKPFQKEIQNLCYLQENKLTERLNPIVGNDIAQ